MGLAMAAAGATRRGVLAAGAAAGAALACRPPGGGGSGGGGPRTGPVEIKLSSWNYRSDLVREYLDAFEQQNPDIKASGPEDGPSSDPYRKRLDTQFLAGEPLDAVYLRDEDVAEWAEAKWIRPLDDLPGSKDLERDEYPFVREQTHHKGQRFGTIYYVGPQVFMYNREHLRKAGEGRPAETYDALRELGLTLKRRGVAEFPIWGQPGEGQLAARDGVERGVTLWTTMRDEFRRSRGQ
jgi:ABC-type glycerol-3-phosphate transport system substrate-binding protein